MSSDVLRQVHYSASRIGWYVCGDLMRMDQKGHPHMTQLDWYGVDPLMGSVDRLPLITRDAPDGVPPSPRARPLGVRLARMPMKVDKRLPQCGEHSKTYTVDHKKENTKIIIDGNEENHEDENEIERETD